MLKDEWKPAVGVTKPCRRAAHLAVLIVGVIVPVSVVVRERHYLCVAGIVEARLRRECMDDFQPDRPLGGRKLLQLAPDVLDGLIGCNVNANEDVQALLCDDLVQRAIGLRELVEYARNLAGPARSLLPDIGGAARREIVEQAHSVETGLRLRRLAL